MTNEPEPRFLEPLTEEDCWKLLRQEQVGRLAVAINNEPDIFPVNFKVEDQTLIIRTAPGLKLAAAVLGKSVAFEVDTIDEKSQSGQSVVVRGVAREIGNLDERLAAEDLHVRPWASGHKDRDIQSVPNSISGRVLPS